MSRTWSKLQVSLLGLLDYNHSHLVSCCTFFYIMIMVYLDMKVEFWWNFKKNREKRERRETHLLTTKPKKGIKIFTLRCNCKVEEFRCNMGDEMINWFSVLDWFLTNYCPTWITIMNVFKNTWSFVQPAILQVWITVRYNIYLIA